MGLIQSKQGSGSASPLNITLDNPTTAGNTLIILIAASGTSANPTSVSGATLGGAADNFAQDATFGSASDAAIGATWSDPACTGGQTAVAISTSGGSGTLALIAAVYEWSGLIASHAAFDQSANSVSGGSTSWTSTATGTTAQAAEVAFGAVFCTDASAGTITGPSSPWNNLTQVNQVQGAFNDSWMSGYQILSSVGTVTYNGTVAPSQQWISKVVTFKVNITSGPVFMPSVRRLPAVAVSNSGWRNAGHSR